MKKNLVFLLILSWVFPSFGLAGGLIGSGGTTGVCSLCRSGTDGSLYRPNTATEDSSLDAWIAMPFNLGANKCISGVTASAFDNGSSYGLTGEIYTDSSGSPGSIVAPGYTSTMANIPDAIANNVLSFAVVQNLPTGDYWIVIKPTGTVNWGKRTSGGITTLKFSALKNGSDWLPTTWKVDLGVLGCSQ
jgi:hypothetical protein